MRPASRSALVIRSVSALLLAALLPAAAQDEAADERRRDASTTARRATENSTTTRAFFLLFRGGWTIFDAIETLETRERRICVDPDLIERVPERHLTVMVPIRRVGQDTSKSAPHELYERPPACRVTL